LIEGAALRVATTCDIFGRINLVQTERHHTSTLW